MLVFSNPAICTAPASYVSTPAALWIPSKSCQRRTHDQCTELLPWCGIEWKHRIQN
jgi:hypothetical protein